MSENIESKSLVQLASLGGGLKKGEPDARTRMSIANSTRHVSFDGFLNTFLGREADASGRPKRSGSAGPSASSSAAAGGKMKPADKESLKKSMDKTVEGEAATDGDVAAAAEEAAVLIWNLIYGVGGGAAVAEEIPDSLRRLADMLNGSGGAGAPGLGLDAVQDALNTSNASAEMNSAAILASVDELLEGMPRHVLDEALAKMSGQLGLPTSGFEGVLAMLKGQVVGVNTQSGQSLLGMLSASANGSANPALPAEISAESEALQSLEDVFQDFLSEKNLDSAEGEDAEALANEFADWLKKSGKSKEINYLMSDKFDPRESAASKLFGNSDGKNQAFSEILKNLESTLQSTTQTESAGDSLSGNSNGNGNAQNQTTAFTQPNSVHPGQSANVQNAQATTVSTLLQQIENIEKLSEAMKMATKGGVNNITMQLAPAELGRLVLKVESKNGVVSAKLKVEKREAAAQLGANLHQLKENLKALGIELGDVEIETDDSSAGETATDLLDELAKDLNLFA